MSKVYDLIIVGSGPAGLSAGIYARRAELDAIIIEKNGMSGGQIINTFEVDNYPGVPGISGFDLADKFRKHCDEIGVTFVTGDVGSFQVEDEIKKIVLLDGTEYLTKTIMIGTGAVYRKLGVKGESEFAGMGVSYCATCDGAFFRGKTAVVVGGGDVAVEDAIYLSRLCKKVYVVHRREEFRAAKSLVTRLQELENVELYFNYTVEEILGDEIVNSICLKHISTGERKELEVQGVFIAIGTTPSSTMYSEFLETDKNGYIIAGETCETSVPGVYAAGDIRTKPLRQIVTAVSDGANAITAIEKYLNQ